MENVPGAFEVVLEAMSGQDSSRQALDIENIEKHQDNPGFLASHRSVLEASWSVLEAFEGVLEVLEGVLKASWWRLGDQHEPRCQKIEKSWKHIENTKENQRFWPMEVRAYALL